MKISKLLLLVVAPLLLSACGGEEDTSTSGSDLPSKGLVPVTISGMLRSGTSYNESFSYDDAWFSKSATEANKDLRLLSFASSVVSSDKYLNQKFYSGMHFSDASFGGYDATNENTIGYSFASKPMDGFNLVAVSIRGFNYGQEWANNALVGKEGNHQGFNDRANDVYDALKTYLKKYEGKNKIWISGYSRGGAVANCLASKLLKERNEISIAKEDLFVYTFEAPRSVSKANAVAYENVFNYVSSTDLIANLVPNNYDLYRCGNEIALNEETNVDATIARFDATATLPTFTPASGKYGDEKEFIKYLIDTLLENPGESGITLQDRTSFFNNYQPHLSYFLGLYYSSDAVASAIKAKFTNSSQSQIMSAINNNELYEFIHPVLDNKGVEYDATKFDAACDAIGKLVKAKKDFILEFFVDQAVMSNLNRVIAMHYPDTTYAIIK